MKQVSIRDMIKEVYLLKRNYVSDDLKKSIDLLASHCSARYKDHSFRSGLEYNGWVVPKKWHVQEAKIMSNGKVVYDATKHPMGVAMQSCSFEGKMSLVELKKHLFTAPNRPNAIPYHFRIQYRPWIQDWGICLPQKVFKTLNKSSYHVVLKTVQTPDRMIVREFTLPGTSKDVMLFVAHIDHPGMANDDVSGCAVGIALLNEIKKRYKKHHYTYKVILTQEIVGSVFYMSGLPSAEKKHIKHAMFLEMLGNDNNLILQSSLHGDAYIDRVCKLALQAVAKHARYCGFRESAGNDEIVFEAPGYEIPTPSLSRWPYDEYHTSDDNMDIISENKLQDSLNVLLEMIFIMEHDAYVKRKFTGLVSFANPKYDLYIDPGQVIDGTLGQNASSTIFQYKMPRFLEGNNRLSDLAIEFGLPFRWITSYFQKLQVKKLVTLQKTKKKRKT